MNVHNSWQGGKETKKILCSTQLLTASFAAHTSTTSNVG